MTYDLTPRHGYHDYSHIFEWLRSGVVTYEDYARMIADDVADMERTVLEGLSEIDMLETTFNADVFDTSRADLIDTLFHAGTAYPFFQRREPDDQS
ncbi:MAG: hypothetical protein O7E52_07930 [Candidatus Poribacteria bacterium]|nr:hypothetical protein [Candidatus Poribacteria bacterium]